MAGEEGLKLSKERLRIWNVLETVVHHDEIEGARNRVERTLQLNSRPKDLGLRPIGVDPSQGMKAQLFQFKEKLPITAADFKDPRLCLKGQILKASEGELWNPLGERPAQKALSRKFPSVTKLN